MKNHCVLVTDLQIRRYVLPSDFSKIPTLIPRALWLTHTLKKNQWFSEQELRALQTKKLRALLRHAYSRVPFYHQRFRSIGLYPDDIKGVEDLGRLPIITKDDVERAGTQIVADNIDLKKSFKTHTSGTMGHPLRVYYDPRYLDHITASSRRYRSVLGRKSWEKTAVVRFSDTDSKGEAGQGIAKKTFHSFRRNYSRNYYISYSANEIAKELSDFQPDVLFGRPIYLRLLAEEFRRTGHKISPRLVLSRGDVLDHSNRKFIETTLGCDVYDSYGGNDAGPIAWECLEKDGYHMESDMTICEFLKGEENANPKEVSDIVVTNLNNYAMPLIRYRSGDKGSYRSGMCACGRTLPILESVEGREKEFLAARNEERLSPKTLQEIAYSNNSLPPMFQIFHERDHFSIHVYGEDVSDDSISDLKAKFSDVFGETDVVKHKENAKANMRFFLNKAS